MKNLNMYLNFSNFSNWLLNLLLEMARNIIDANINYTKSNLNYHEI